MLSVPPTATTTIASPDQAEPTSYPAITKECKYEFRHNVVDRTYITVTDDTITIGGSLVIPDHLYSAFVDLLMSIRAEHGL